jgi:hypothetical protein
MFLHYVGLHVSFVDNYNIVSTSEWAWASRSRRDQTRDKHLHTHVCAASTRQHVVGYTHLLLPELTTHACDVHQLLNAQKLDRFRSVSEAMTAEKLLCSFHEFIQSSFVPYYYNLGSNPNQRVVLGFFFLKKEQSVVKKVQSEIL